VEHSTIGREGAVGILAFLGRGNTFHRAVVQLPGPAWRLDVNDLRRLGPQGSPLHDLLCRYTVAFVRHLAQSAACNAIHSIRQRCCRWLLTTHDRVRSDEFPLTQELFAQMLGVRRASVAEVARLLQRTGLIRYRRGLIAILDRSGLEKAACECYGIIKAAFGRVAAAKS